MIITLLANLRRALGPWAALLLLPTFLTLNACAPDPDPAAEVRVLVDVAQHGVGLARGAPQDEAVGVQMLGQRGQSLVGLVRRCAAEHDGGVLPVQTLGRRFDRRAYRKLLAVDCCGSRAGLRLEFLVGVAALVAHPVAVDLRVKARCDAVGLFVLRVEFDRTPRRTTRAGGVRTRKLPGADREPEVL